MENNVVFKDVDPKVSRDLRQAYEHDAISHSYLFVSSDNQVAVATANWLACLFLCEGEADNRPDGTCANCQRVLSSNHPDVFLVEELEKQSLGISLIRPLKEELAKSPVEGSRRFFIINDAQKMTLSASNALLNVLEEPIAPVVTILIANNVNQILPTIISRTQLVNFENTTENIPDSVANLGLSSSELDQLEDTTELEELIQGLYNDLVQHNNHAVLTVKQILDLNISKAAQSFVLAKLQQITDQNLQAGNDLQINQQILSTIFKVNEMRSYNVSFSSCLNYLILAIEFWG